MGAYILVLIMVVKAGSAGMGGLAMQEFSSLDKCNSAGSLWVNDTVSKHQRVYRNELSFICVPK